MKKLNLFITSAVCVSLMSVNAAAVSDECKIVYEDTNNINAIVSRISNIKCDYQAVLKNIFENCLDIQWPNIPNLPESDIEPDQEQIPPILDIPEQENPDGNNTNVDLSNFELRVVELVNAERAKKGLHALNINNKLSDVAREKSRDMQKNGYFSHTSPTYGTPFEMLRRFGISYNTAGENIAMGYASPEAVVNGWMNSPGHRANILSSSFSEIGVGHISDGNYWTQLFIG